MPRTVKTYKTGVVSVKPYQTEDLDTFYIYWQADQAALREDDKELYPEFLFYTKTKANEKTMGNQRKYHKDECASFLRTNEKYGGFSNMAAGYLIKIPTSTPSNFYTSEALYQAARWPNEPSVQKLIARKRSPLDAKRSTREFIKDGRQDWPQVKVKIMKWCLRAKLICNWHSFGKLLRSTGNMPIVEISYRDPFWGAKPNGNYIIGQNALGRLLMEIRRDLVDNEDILKELKPPEINDFLFFDSKVSTLKL